jgi:hypothetical protein
MSLSSQNLGPSHQHICTRIQSKNQPDGKWLIFTSERGMQTNIEISRSLSSSVEVAEHVQWPRNIFEFHGYVLRAAPLGPAEPNQHYLGPCLIYPA